MRNAIGLAALTSTVTSGERLLNLAITSAGTVGTNVLCLGSRNITLANNGNYKHLCIFRDTSGKSIGNAISINTLRYALMTSGLSYCILGQLISDNIPVNSLVLGNEAIAINAEGDIIAQDVTALVGTPDEEDVIFIGDSPLRVIYKAPNWYMVFNV